jgi:hypothetical protein
MRNFKALKMGLYVMFGLHVTGSGLTILLRTEYKLNLPV